MSTPGPCICGDGDVPRTNPLCLHSKHSSMGDDEIRDDIRSVVLILNELVNSGARICTHKQRMDAWARAAEAP